MTVLGIESGPQSQATQATPHTSKNVSAVSSDKENSNQSHDFRATVNNSARDQVQISKEAQDLSQSDSGSKSNTHQQPSSPFDRR